MIRGIGHCGLVVRDLAATRRFYRELLSMEEVERPRIFTFRGARFRGGTCEFHAILAGDTTAPPGMPDPGAGKRTGLAAHVAFEVDDLACLAARLRAAAVTVAGGPIGSGDGAHQMWVFDPDGYLVELFQITDTPIEAPERGAVGGGLGERSV